MQPTHKLTINTAAFENKVLDIALTQPKVSDRNSGLSYHQVQEKNQRQLDEQISKRADNAAEEEKKKDKKQGVTKLSHEGEHVDENGLASLMQLSTSQAVSLSINNPQSAAIHPTGQQSTSVTPSSTTTQILAGGNNSPANISALSTATTGTDASLQANLDTPEFFNPQQALSVSVDQQPQQAGKPLDVFTQPLNGQLPPPVLPQHRLQSMNTDQLAKNAAKQPAAVNIAQTIGSGSHLDGSMSGTKADVLTPLIQGAGSTQSNTKAATQPGTVSTQVSVQNPQWAKAMANNVQMLVSKTAQRLEIRMDPPELGRIDVTLANEQGGQTIQFVTETQAARDLLQQNLAQLEKQIQEQFGTNQDFGLQLSVATGQQQGGGEEMEQASVTSENEIADEQTEIHNQIHNLNDGLVSVYA